MGAAKIGRALIALAALAPLGCAPVLNWLDRPFRTPGERLKAFPERVFEEYDCADKKLPFFEIERFELYPRRLAPGEEFGHRLVYVLCPRQTTGVVTGELRTRILFRGEPIVVDAESGYDLKPGRWVLDAFITLPIDARQGIYALDLQFTSPSIRFERMLEFAVDAAPD